jgi:multiple sugar transport system ATP-binding protein
LGVGVRRLSGGEMQRVSIGRAIVRDPAVLIMDEPISHLDAGLRARMRDELKTQAGRLGVTTLYITHDQVEAMAMADRIAVMNRGRIQQIGTPLEIYHHPRNEFVAGFIGEPPMNFIVCDVRSEGETLWLETPAFCCGLTGTRARRLAEAGRTRIKLGIRPEDVCVSAEPYPGSFGLEVDFVEPQGDRTIITLRLGDGEVMLAQLLGDWRPARGQAIHVAFDQRHLHGFDLDSGLNVLAEAA